MSTIAAATAATATKFQEEESQYASAQPSVTALSSLLPTCTTSPSPILQSSLLGEQPPKHRMCRDVKTVEALWLEWTEGLQGQPSIRDLDSRWGYRWRTGRQSELQWYSLRLEVIKEIQRIAKAERIAEHAAMWKLHVNQQRMNCSLDRFCKRLRTNKRA